ncbi:MAG: hypothetical protein KAH62_01155 [Desulfobacula sp.]|nr:hypothetical protein [Desulfobacula sp.]
MNDFLQSLRNGQADKQRTPKTRKNSDNSYHYTSFSRFHSYGGYQNNRNQHMKRPTAPRQTGNQLPMDETATTSMLAEAIENLSSHVEILVKNQDHLINAQEKTADMIERQAIAIERIVDHLNIAPGKQPVPEKKTVSKETFKHHYVTAKKQEPDITKPVKAPVKNIEPVKPVLRKRKKLVAKKTKKTASLKKAALSDTKLLSREAVMDIIHSMRAESATFGQVASRLIELGQPTFSGRGEWHAQTIHRLCNKK